MNIDFSNIKPDDLKFSEKYLTKTLATNIIEDVAKPEMLDYMKYAQILAGYVLTKEGDIGLYHYWKAIYKACEKSEKDFNYQLYKGHILVQMALSYLVAHRELRKVVELLELSYQADKDFGYKNPTYKSAYKILSFLQPLLLFESDLWPSNEEVRRKFANRLCVVLSFNRSATAIAIHPDLFKKSIKSIVTHNSELLKILNENVDELFEIMELSEKQLKFHKSAMFLAANIIEGVLYSIALDVIKDGEAIKRLSISKLAKLLLQKGKVTEVLYYQCKFIESYRDFIHPARNLQHKYTLDINFNKFFILYLSFLLGELYP